ncbi:unnamed protein product [Amoebophrya sp. A120]|nr:unnamed protein product [Amoebophrya sp. A120]|eukprot:GSA120T00019599001.1
MELHQQERLASLLVKKSPRRTPRAGRVLLHLSPRHMKKATCTMKKVMISAVLLCGQELLTAPLCCVAFTLNKLRPQAASSSFSPEEAEKLRRCKQHADTKRLECHADAYGSFDNVVDDKSVNAKVSEIYAAVKLIEQIDKIHEQEQQTGAGAGAPVAGPGRGADAPPAVAGVQRAEEVQQDEPGAVSQAMRDGVAVDNTGRPVGNYLNLWQHLGDALVQGLPNAVQLVKAARRCVLPRKQFVEENCATYVRYPTATHRYADTEFVKTWGALEDAHAVIHNMEQLYIGTAVLSAKQEYLRSAIKAGNRHAKKRQQKELKQKEAEAEAWAQEQEETRKKLEQDAFELEQEKISNARTEILEKLKEEQREEQEAADWDAVIRQIKQECEDARDRERKKWTSLLHEMHTKAIQGERISLHDYKPSGDPDGRIVFQKNSKNAQLRHDLSLWQNLARRARGRIPAHQQAALLAPVLAVRGGDLEALLSAEKIEAVWNSVFRATEDATTMARKCGEADVFMQNILTEPTSGIQTLLQGTQFGSLVERYSIETNFRTVCVAAPWRSAFLTIDLALTQYKASVHFAKKVFEDKKLTLHATEVVPYGIFREWEVEEGLDALVPPGKRTKKLEEPLAKAQEVRKTLRQTARLPPLTPEEKQVPPTAELFQAGTKKGPLRTSFEAAKKMVEDAEITQRKIQQNYFYWANEQKKFVKEKTERNAVLREAEERAVLLAAARYEIAEIGKRETTWAADTTPEHLFGQFVEGFRKVLHLQAESGSAFAALLSQWTRPAAEGGPPRPRLPILTDGQELDVLRPLRVVESDEAAEEAKVVAYRYRFSAFPDQKQYPFLATLCLLRSSQDAIGRFTMKSEDDKLLAQDQSAIDTLYNQLKVDPRTEVLKTLTMDVVAEELVPALLLTALLPVPKLLPRPLAADDGTGSRSAALPLREASTSPEREEGLRRVPRSSSRSARGRSKAKSPSPSRDAAEPHGRSSSRNGSSPSRSPSRGRKKCCTRRRSRLDETSCTLS